MEPLYDRHYRSAKLDEGAAIQLNDYLMLGMTIGLSGLLCFATYIGLSLRGSPEPKFQNASSAECRVRSAEQPVGTSEMAWLWVVCRAGGIVLMVGFWFDGGLFKLYFTRVTVLLVFWGTVGNSK